MSLEFALDLVRQRILSPQELLQLLDRTESDRRPFGRVAIELGLLSIRQVHEIHELQATSRRSFGAWASALGWLTEDEVHALVAHQQLTRPAICGALVELGILDAVEVAALYRTFQRRTARHAVDATCPPPPKFRKHEPHRLAAVAVAQTGRD